MENLNGSWVGHPTSTQTTETVTSWHFSVGETQKQSVILTALAQLCHATAVKMTCCFSVSPIQKHQQCQCSPDTSQSCTKCACYQKTSSIGKFLSSSILISLVPNHSSSQSTPVIPASSPPSICLAQKLCLLVSHGHCQLSEAGASCKQGLTLHTCWM